jgi:hypothetical protein
MAKTDVYALLDDQGNPIPQAQLQQAFSAGAGRIAAGGKLRMLTPQGETRIVDAKELGQAVQLGYQPMPFEQQQAQAEQERYSTGDQTVEAALEEGTSYIPFVGQPLLNLRGEEARRGQELRRKYNPLAAQIGGVASLVGQALLPGLGEVGAARAAGGLAARGLAEEAAGLAARAISAPMRATVSLPGELAARGVAGLAETMGVGAASAGRLARVAQMGVEGAALGASAQMAEDELHATPFDAEKIAHSAATGALWGMGGEVGLQVIGSAIKGAGRIAKQVAGAAKDKALGAAETATEFLTGVPKETIRKFGPREALREGAAEASALTRYAEAPRIREKIAEELAGNLDEFNRALSDVLDQNVIQKTGKIPAMTKLVETGAEAFARQRAAALNQVSKLQSAAEGMRADPTRYGKRVSDLTTRINELGEQVLRAKDGGEMFGAVDQAKRELDRLAKSAAVVAARGGGTRAMAPMQLRAQRDVLQSMAEDTRQMLMQDSVWGAKAAGAQREINGAWQGYLGNPVTGDPGTQQRFQRDFFERLGEDYHTGRPVYRASSQRMSGFVGRMGRVENVESEALFKRQIEQAENLSNAIDKHYGLQDELADKAKIVRERAQVIKKKLAEHESDLKDWAEIDELASAPQRGLLGGVSAAGQLGGTVVGAHELAYGSPVVGGAIMGAKLAARAVTDPLATAQQILTVRRAARQLDARLGTATRRIVQGTQRTMALAPMVAAGVVSKEEAKEARKESRFDPSDVEVAETMYNLREFAKLPPEEQVYSAMQQIGPLAERYPRQAALAAQVMTQQAGYLAAKVPAPAPPARSATPLAELGEKPVFSRLETEQFREELRAVVDPVSVIEDLGDGKISLAALRAVKQNSPAIWNRAREMVMQQLALKESPIGHRQARLLGTAFDIVAVPENDAATGAAAQSALSAYIQSQQQQPSGQGSSGSGRMSSNLATQSQKIESGESVT